jgi:hypothetical protein
MIIDKIRVAITILIDARCPKYTEYFGQNG